MASIVSKFNLFIKNIYLDYYEVFKDIKRSARNKPFKATLYGASTLFVLNLFRTNEDLRSYHSEVVSACNRVGSITEGSRNPRSYKFAQAIGELDCHGLLRQVDLGFSTVIYKTETNPETALYRYNCPHLNPSIKEFVRERLVDWGFLGHWLMLEVNMHDYDINDEEFEQFVKSSDSSGNNMQRVS